MNDGSKFHGNPSNSLVVEFLTLYQGVEMTEAPTKSAKIENLLADCCNPPSKCCEQTSIHNSPPHPYMKVCHRKLRAYVVALQLFTGDIVCQRHILPPVTEGGQLAGKTVMNVFGDFMETERLGVKIVLSVNRGGK